MNFYYSFRSKDFTFTAVEFNDEGEIEHNYVVSKKVDDFEESGW